MQALIIVTWEEFKSAANIEDGMTSGKDILSTFRWKQCNSGLDSHTWEDGTQMSAKDVAEYMRMPFPFSF